MVPYFGIQTSTIHNRDPRFTSNFLKSLLKLLESRATAILGHYPQADGKTECMNRTIGQIFYAYLLDKVQEYWPDYVALTEMAMSSIFHASINKAPFEVFYREKIPFPVDLLLSRESCIKLHAHTFYQLATKVKSAMHAA